MLNSSGRLGSHSRHACRTSAGAPTVRRTSRRTARLPGTARIPARSRRQSSRHRRAAPRRGRLVLAVGSHELSVGRDDFGREHTVARQAVLAGKPADRRPACSRRPLPRPRSQIAPASPSGDASALTSRHLAAAPTRARRFSASTVGPGHSPRLQQQRGHRRPVPSRIASHGGGVLREGSLCRSEGRALASSDYARSSAAISGRGATPLSRRSYDLSVPISRESSRRSAIAVRSVPNSFDGAGISAPWRTARAVGSTCATDTS